MKMGDRPMAAKVQQFHSGSRHTRAFFWCTHETKGRRVRKGRDPGPDSRIRVPVGISCCTTERSHSVGYSVKKKSMGRKNSPSILSHCRSLFYSYGCCCYLAGHPSVWVVRVDDLRTGRQSTVAAHCDRRQPAGLIIPYRP